MYAAFMSPPVFAQSHHAATGHGRPAHHSQDARPGQPRLLTVAVGGPATRALARSRPLPGPLASGRLRRAVPPGASRTPRLVPVPADVRSVPRHAAVAR